MNYDTCQIFSTIVSYRLQTNVTVCPTARAPQTVARIVIRRQSIILSSCEKDKHKTLNFVLSDGFWLSSWLKPRRRRKSWRASRVLYSEMHEGVARCPRVRRRASVAN